MAEIITMPRLSDTMTEGVVAQWLKKVGDKVSEGDILAEIETDKATMEFESFQDGVLLHIGVQTGDAAPVDGVLCVLGEKGEDIKKLLADAAKASTASNEPAPVSTDKPPVAIVSNEVTPQKPPASPTPVAAASVPVSRAPNTRVIASPLAKKLADKLGLSLDRIPGSGEGGRVVKSDVENFKMASASGMPVVSQERFSEVGVSQMRKTIARRLSESKFQAPHFYLTIEVNMNNTIAARKKINELAPSKVSFNDIVIKATAAALRKNPAVNASWLGDKIRYNNHIHIG